MQSDSAGAEVEKKIHIAVLPVYNLSATPAPLKEIRQLLLDSLKKKGLNILDDEVLEGVFVKHRIRYLGGIDQLTARAFRQEAGVEAVLIISLELFSDIPPPKIALTSRLVTTANDPQILWIDGIGLTGDDSPGFLDLSLVENPQALLEMAVQRLSNSLMAFLSAQKGRVDFGKAHRKFRPKDIYRSPVLAPDMKYKLAVIPFFNIGERKHAGEIIALHFIRQLWALENFSVIEPGVVRQALLRMRIIMGYGISLADADLIFRKLNTNLVLNGMAVDYQDYQGLSGQPKVNFSAQIVERKSREVVWSVKSYNEGDDGVFFFSWGRVNTAHAMAAQMVQLAVEDIIK